MSPWLHAVSTAKKHGGREEDYIEIHAWLDETKAFTGDWTHRALRHHALGIQQAIDEFGHAVTNTDGKKVPVKLIAEQHVVEDCGYIPTVADWLKPLSAHPEKWMLRVATKSADLGATGPAPNTKNTYDE